jgi:hypothetical protein
MNPKELLIISLTVFLTIIAWVVSELYVIRKETPTEQEIQSVSLNYSIDTTILDELEKKIP